MDVEDLVIAKMDVTVNEADGLKVSGFPSLRFYPKDNKAGITYDGVGRELLDLKTWLWENSPAYNTAFPSNPASGDMEEEL